MAQPALQAALHQLRRKMQAQQRSVLTDGQLLQRYLREHDETAFTTLAQRHAGMICTVARRVLHDGHEAEDVFQATLLVLAKKAGSIRRQPALAGWLCQVAFRLALRAKADRGRRRAGESGVATMPQESPNTCFERAELRTLLDRELSYLPDKYRAPLVLHYLEGKSKSETAGQLGWTEGTVSGRLARGRELLRQRLRRCGFVLSSTGIASILLENAATAAVPTTLLMASVEAALAFARGTAAGSTLSPVAVGLAKGLLHTMVVGKMKVATWLMLLLALVAAGAGTAAYRATADHAGEDQAAAHAGSGDTTPAANKKAKAEPATSPTDRDPQAAFSASGKVVDQKGKPVSGAKIYLREQSTGWNSSTWRPVATRNITLATTEPDGAFRFNNVALPTHVRLREQYYPLDIIVTAKGYALAWKHLEAALAARELSFVLQPESKITGRVVDHAGKPASKVTVRVLQIMALTAGARPHGGRVELDLSAPTFLNLDSSKVRLEAVTDSEGRFQLANLPPEMRVDLLIADDRFLSKEMYVATTEARQPQLVQFASEYPGGKETLRKETVYNSGFTVALENGTRFHGQVIFEDTGKPALGARFTYTNTFPEPAALVDAGGRFSVTQRPLGQHLMQVVPPAGTTYLPEYVRYEFTATKRVIEATVKLRRGVPIAGKVIDEETGRGVPDVVVSCSPSSPAPSVSSRTGADGRFHLIVRPGKGTVYIPQAPSGYLSSNFAMTIEKIEDRYKREIVAGEAQPSKDVTFALTRGFVVRGRVVDREGNPVPRVGVDGATAVAPGRYQELHVSGDEEGGFVFGGLRAGERWQLAFHSAQRALGAVMAMDLPAGKTSVDLKVTLLPTGVVEGRVIDENQKPLTDVRVSVTATFIGSSSVGRPSTHTDALGKYRLAHVLPEDQVAIYASAEGYSSFSSNVFKTESGKTYALRDISLVKLEQVVAGVVVDGKGKPLPEVDVFSSPAFGLPRYASKRVLTDDKGRFRLMGLPRGAIDLWGVYPWDRGHSSLLQRVRAGDQNLRIVVVIPGTARAPGASTIRDLAE